MPDNSNGRAAPLIVAVSLFMENMDSTVIATSLPAIARDIGSNPLALKLAVTSYLLSLAIFIPASGWTADRFGARTVFRIAIGVFVLGSIGCALSHSLEDFVAARIFQGMGGAMMTPVGRLIVVRSIDKERLLNAMSLLTIPALIGPICGPPLGGFITTYASWHWIFIINVPIGLLGIVLATRYIPDIRAEYPYPFDLAGFILSGLAIGGLAFGLSVAGLEFLPNGVVAAFLGVGAISAIGYVIYAQRATAPILDLKLLQLPTFRASIFGGFMFRLGVGAMPFLLPLLLQIGFGLSPFQSGLITFTSALGSMFMKAAATTVLKHLGYRNVLLYNSLVSAVFIGACATFVHGMPFAAMIAILLVGGFFRSLEFTSVNTIAYAEITPPMLSRATSMVAAFQQLSLSTGVAIGALVVEITLRIKHSTTMGVTDFPPAFLAISLLSAAAALIFMRLPTDAGAELSGRRTARAAGAAAPKPINVGLDK
ncbi:MAG: MFS transporter [Xanthobacteraceae bacterium]